MAKFRMGLAQMACALDPNENPTKAEWRIPPGARAPGGHCELPGKPCTRATHSTVSAMPCCTRSSPRRYHSNWPPSPCVAKSSSAFRPSPLPAAALRVRQLACARTAPPFRTRAHSSGAPSASRHESTRSAWQLRIHGRLSPISRRAGPPLTRPVSPWWFNWRWSFRWCGSW